MRYEAAAVIFSNSRSLQDYSTSGEQNIPHAERGPSDIYHLFRGPQTTQNSGFQLPRVPSMNCHGIRKVNCVLLSLARLFRNKNFVQVGEKNHQPGVHRDHLRTTLCLSPSKHVGRTSKHQFHSVIFRSIFFSPNDSVWDQS